jgi:hypothetical protein
MTGGARCTVCDHPRIAEIDANLSDPPMSGYTKNARIFGLRTDAVRRHKMNGHVVKPKPPSAPQEPKEVEALPMSAVEVLSKTLKELNAVDSSELSGRELNIHIDLKRKVAVDLAKYQVAIDREGPAVKELRALEEMVLIGDEVLERFPEARRAISQAVAEWKARRTADEDE